MAAFFAEMVFWGAIQGHIYTILVPIPIFCHWGHNTAGSGRVQELFLQNGSSILVAGPEKTNPSIDLATDIADARTSSEAWIVMGSLATAFMAVTCYGGWWYQRMIRHRFIEAVKGMWIPGSILATIGSDIGPSGRAVTKPDDRDSMVDPLLPGEASPMWPGDGFSPFESHDSGRGSYIRGLSPEPSGRTTSIYTPSIMVSYDDGGEDIGLLPFDHVANSRRPRPRTNS